jgi:hypothetical protein
MDGNQSYLSPKVAATKNMRRLLEILVIVVVVIESDELH